MRRPDSSQREASRDRPGSRQNQGPTALGDLLAPRQPRKQSLSGRKPQVTNVEDDAPDTGLEQTSNIKLIKTGAEESKGPVRIPTKLIKPINKDAQGQHRRESPLGRVVAQAAAQNQRARPTVMSSIASVASTQKAQQVAPVKLQKLDVERLRKTFYGFTEEFAAEIDLYFKNYNRFIKESKNKIDVQVKASKREKLMHAQFLNREEIKFWKEFPRSLKFYHQSLFGIKQALESAHQQAGAKQNLSVHATNTVEVRDVSDLVLMVLDFQPFASWKFCNLFSVEQKELFTDDTWRNASISGADFADSADDQRTVSEAFLSPASSFQGLSAPTNISTFDNLTQSLKMFDSDDTQNWRVLGLAAMLLAADTLALILEQPSKLQQDENKKNGIAPLPKIEVSHEVSQILIEFCKKFASFKFPQDAGDDTLEELTIVDILFDKVQFTWANKIYPSLSTFSSRHFDICLQFLQRALNNDHRALSSGAKEICIQEIYFARYLVITPGSLNQADKVLGLLEKFIQLLGSDHANDDFKLGLLATLKYLLENLCFYNSEVCGRQNILPLRGCSFDPNAMQIQAASVARIYQAAESLAQRQSYKEHAILLMATILKISHDDFVEQKFPSFLTLIKFREFFKSKKTYAFELKLTNQLYLAGPIHLQKYKAWQPKVHVRQKLMIENRAFKVLTPVVDVIESREHVSLGRKVDLRSVPQNLVPQALAQPRRGPRYLIHSLPDYFHMIFSPALVGLKTCPVDYTHWQFLEQAVYDDFEFMSQAGMQYLLDQRWTDLGIPVLNLGLKLADYILDPSKGFREKYYQLHGGLLSQKGMMLGQQIKNMRTKVCQVLKHIFRSELHLNTEFMTNQLTFFRDSQTKGLCNDEIAAIWSKPDYDRLLQRPSWIAQDLKRQDLAKFHLQERHRLITFEDLNEINSHNFTYENHYLNLLQKDIDEYLSKRMWDKKHEKFIRKRLSCFIAQHTSSAQQTKASASPLLKGAGAQGIAQRQNTSFYNAVPDSEREQLRLLRSLVKMLHYLPEMHEFFKFSPSKHITRAANALLTNRVQPIDYASEEQEEETKQQVPAQMNSESAVPQESSEGHQADANDQPKLSEVKKLLPHLLLCLDYRVAQKTMKCLQKMMIYGDLSMRISLVDQMIYFIKELMLESPDDFLVSQCLQTLTSMIKIWHQSEKIKFQATTDQEIRPGFKLASYQVFDLVSAGGESLQAQALDDAAKNMYKELHQHLQMFDLIDMISLLSLCNKDTFARSLGCILIQETGKLKRLLVHKDKQRYILSDVLYYNRDQMIDNLTRRLNVFYGLKGQGFKTSKQLKQIFERLQFQQFMVDNFEYQKFGLWEGLVRDIQVLYVGDLTRIWKETLLKHTRVGGVILNYIQHLSGISLALYENKHGSVQDAAAQVSTQKDCVGFNLLLALVLFNVTKSHDARNRIPKVASQPSNEDSEELEEVFSSGKLTTNTIMDESAALIALTETNFNQMHKITFSTFYPARLWTSNVLLSFIFYLQQPLDQKSLRNLNEIFITRRLDFQQDAKQQQFLENCVIFYTLLMQNANDQFAAYVLDQLEHENKQQEEQIQALQARDADQEEIPFDIADAGYPVSKNLLEMTNMFVNTLEQIDFTDDAQGKKKFTVRISMAHSICKCIQRLRETTSNRVSSTQYLSREQQIGLLQETRSQFNAVSKSADMQWLCPLIQEIWFYLLSFEAIIGGNLNLLDDIDASDAGQSKAPQPKIPAKLLDLKFLIQLEQDGFTGALKYYKYFHLLATEPSNLNPRMTASNDAARINEIKLLIQHIYAFFGSKRSVNRSQYPEAPLQSDLSQISGFSADVSNYSRYPDAAPVRPQKNVYFKCLVNCVIDTIALCKALESLRSVAPEPESEEAKGESPAAEVKVTHAAQLAKSPFAPVYQTLVNCVFKQSKASLESKLRKFNQSNLHSKIFLVSLFVGVNSTDKLFIEKSRILSLAILPIMFPDPAYRKVVENKIIAHARSNQIRTLISHDNKHFFQFIKRVFIGEEQFNMEHHFEKYFSLSGFLRDILNEIIKIQSVDNEQPQISPKMLLKVLDIVTYFFSGNIDLRRVPQAPDAGPQTTEMQLIKSQIPQNGAKEESFIFASLIDYKSFEFLSKLYKISEKLVDHDNDLLIMNMWYKIVENRTHNFEILTKFLIHNLSSFIMKLRATTSKETAVNTTLNSTQQHNVTIGGEEDAYGIEYEKQKRYSLSIFNYIKARTQQIDLRNSLNVSSVCSWSQKMIKLVVRAQLNLHSKYTLEKMKLKKILQIMHAEINKSGVRLELKGGLDTLNRLLNEDESGQHVPGQPRQNVASEAGFGYDDVRRSVSMSQLLQSRTFLNTFGNHNKKDKSTLKQLLFIITRQMSEKFDELTPDNQIMQLPDLVIKYFENTLIMIANESERLQIIKYNVKEEVTVTIIIMILIADLATKQCEINRFYFMYDLLNKLILNIDGINRYLKLSQLSMEQFQSITCEEEVLAVFNYRCVCDNFGAFTQIYFKLLHNTVAITKLHKFMLHLWWLIFEKVQALLSKGDTLAQSRIRESSAMALGGQAPLLRPHYSRKQIVTMLQGCFFTLHQYSIKSQRAREGPDSRHPFADLRLMVQNFASQIKCAMEYIQPGQLKLQTMRDFSDPNAQEISFATNAAFWLCYACLEACAIAQSAHPIEDPANLDQTVASGVGARDVSADLRHLEQIQELAMLTMRRILEESDFLKLLIGIQKLSPHFYSYSLSLKSGKTALLPLLFSALENSRSCEDAYKSLIVTIRIQDSHLLTSSQDEEARGETELHRFLLLVPFFYQQFLGYAQSTVTASSNLGVRKSTSIFTNKKSIIQLLKKSLLSIGIDRKKEILDTLDEIQIEVDCSEPRVIKEQFGRLISATCEMCIAQGSTRILFEALRTFGAIASASSSSGAPIVVEREIMEQTIQQVRQVIRESDSVEEVEAVGLPKDAAEFYSCENSQTMLGEDVLYVKKEIRPLYFGLKNIILQEIESLDKEIDVHKFFIEEETAGFPASTNLQGYAVSRSRSVYQGPSGQYSNSKANPGSSVGQADGFSDALSDMASSSHQQSTAGYPAASVRMAKKTSQRKQEMISKYQNSQNAAQQPVASLSVSPPLIKQTSSHKAPSSQIPTVVLAQTLQNQPEIIASRQGSSAQQQQYEQESSEDQAYTYTATNNVTNQVNQPLSPASLQTAQKATMLQQHSVRNDSGKVHSRIEDQQLQQKREEVQAFDQHIAADKNASQIRDKRANDHETHLAERNIDKLIEMDVERRSSKVHLEDEERKVQQEQLSQILFEDDEDEGHNAQQQKSFADEMREAEDGLDKVDVALQPAREAARSFAESVKLEEEKHRGDGAKTQAYQPSDFYPQQNPEFRVATDASNQELGGLIGTFAKPKNNQKRVPSLHFTNQTNQSQNKVLTGAGEIPMNQEFNFSQAMSSIEARETDRQNRQRAALIPGFVAEKVNEIISESDSHRDKFGTGDFPEEAPDLLQQQEIAGKSKFQTVNRQNYQFSEPGAMESQQVDDRARMSHMQVNPGQHQLTQRFDAQKEFHSPDRADNRMKTAANMDKQQPPVGKLGGKAANFLDSHKTEDLPTPKKSQALDTILIEIINDEEQFYELENFLSEEKNYDVDSLAFYVKVMEFKKETSNMNATLAAGMIIDNYLAEDAQYYIGNEVKSDDLINRLIGEYEQTITTQQVVSKDLFNGICEQIHHQLMPYLREFKAREPGAKYANAAESSAYSQL